MYKFRKWIYINGMKAFAVIYDTESGEEFYVPRSRLIPTPACEGYARSLGLNDPNKIMEFCVERNSFFGIPVFRHYLHLRAKGDLKSMDVEELYKAYEFPPKTDFSCIRDLILQGKDTDIAIAMCSEF